MVLNCWTCRITLFLSSTRSYFNYLPHLTSYGENDKSTNTVGTPYNTVPYTTGSNIARLGHGSQNLWSKLWIQVVKEILNRFPSVLLSREKASPQENSRYLRPLNCDSPRSYHHMCRRHPPLIWHNRHYMPLWPSIHGLIDANCISSLFTDTWAHRHRHPADFCLQARWTRSVLPK